MKQFILLITTLFLSSGLFAQSEQTPQDGFQFTTVKENPVTSIKNQASSGTCWCFSGIALIESELLRAGKGTYDFSEMFIVHKNYQDKAIKYVRMHGETNFAAGGSFADVIDGIRDYGLVPETEMAGLNYGETSHRHGEMDLLLQSYVAAVIKNKNGKLSPAWFNGYKGIINAYLGECPEKFTYDGKEYTPQSFARSLEINPDDYVSLTSFTHHPFYSSFPVEVQDNWRWALSYNLPLEEMMGIIHHAIDEGHCVAWASDVSEKGFSRNGIAVVPDLEAPEGPGSDQAHWLGLTPTEREKAITDAGKPVKELDVTQEKRQIAFDNYQTTDDHGMLIYGTAKDQNGTIYFLVKNSWGEKNKYKGTWYASEAFVKYKTLNVVVHKDALSKELKKKLNK
ncbi:MAG: aminopeptidase [Dysgonamonadaceae bacterium]|nr:aminopeptidase [Dysgonamonadaceae bacterium]